MSLPLFLVFTFVRKVWICCSYFSPLLGWWKVCARRGSKWKLPGQEASKILLRKYGIAWRTIYRLRDYGISGRRDGFIWMRNRFMWYNIIGVIGGLILLIFIDQEATNAYIVEATNRVYTFFCDLFKKTLNKKTSEINCATSLRKQMTSYPIRTLDNNHNNAWWK